jgi:predicted HAD superfamily Cof-like phosphohydrolase
MAANMAKLGPDGKPIYDEQGKIRKPANWQELHAPEAKIKAEIERQSLCSNHSSAYVCPNCK